MAQNEASVHAEIHICIHSERILDIKITILKYVLITLSYHQAATVKHPKAPNLV